MKNRFTLVEMLIVVAVIGILISILLPSLKNARSEAKNVVCKSNTIQYYNLLLTKVQSDYFTGSKNQGWRKRQYEFRHVGRFPDAKLWESYPLTDPGSGYQKEFIQHVSCPEYDVVFSGNLDIYGYINRTSFAITKVIEGKFMAAFDDPDAQIALGEGKWQGGQGLSADNPTEDRHRRGTRMTSNVALLDGHIENGYHLKYVDGSSGPYYLPAN